jgi:hypothetical protein
MLFDMMVFVASAAQARVRTRSRARRRSRWTPFSGRAAGASQRGLVIVHGLVTLFLQVIVLAIIFLVWGLAVPHVLVIALTTIITFIVSMTIIRLAIIPFASMMVTVFATAMLAVAWFTATCGRKMSRFLFLWLLLVLGNLVKNASRLVGHLTLLKEGNHSERVSRYRLVQVSELVLVRLRLREEDLFTLLLRRGYVHRLAEVATLKVAEKLHSTPHELVHWHERGLLAVQSQQISWSRMLGNPATASR